MAEVDQPKDDNPMAFGAWAGVDMPAGIERAVAVSANRIRRDVINMLEVAGSGHPGGSLSSADILATLFFSGAMRYDRDVPADRSGDRFLLSKGHAAPALYAVYHQLGWIDDDELASLRRVGSRLQGHPDAKFLPAVEACSGSLGQGLAIGCGLALGLRVADSRAEDESLRRVYVLCGDGEMQEGSNWEALMLAAHLRLDNMTMLLDLNGLQIDGTTSEVCSLGDVSKKLCSFGWAVTEVDGHDVAELIDALEWAKGVNGMPQAIVCHTVKGKGVSFMEGERGWHGKAPSHDEAEAARRELDEELARLLQGGAK